MEVDVALKWVHVGDADAKLLQKFTSKPAVLHPLLVPARKPAVRIVQLISQYRCSLEFPWEWKWCLSFSCS